MTKAKESDLQALMEIPAFRRFLFTAIQRAGVLSSATISGERTLEYQEGRRSLGLELLQEAEQALPEKLRDPYAAYSLIAILSEATQQPPTKDSEHESSRYDSDE